MKNFITYIFCAAMLMPMACQAKKTSKKKMYLQKYEWQETVSCPLGYPIDVYMGGLQSEDGGFRSLVLGTHSGNNGWGSAGRSMSNGEKSIPNHLHVKWISYAEKVFYEIDTAIDYDKMLNMFKEGYFTPSMGDNPNPRKENYNQIIVGFAPGGVVVVWLSGAGRQIEVGRYEGKKIVIPQDEINSLSLGPQKNMFDPEYQRKIMYEFKIVPPEIVKANENKPIPIGLWDTYRKQYNWTTVFELPNEGKKDEVDYYLWNGEMEFLFGEDQVKRYKIIPDNLKWDISKVRAAPRKIYFSWYEGKEIHEGTINFDQEEIIKAFETIEKDNPNNKIEILIKVNIPKTAVAIQLISGDEQIWIKKHKIKIS